MMYLILMLAAFCSAEKHAFGQDMTVSKAQAVATSMASKGDTVIMCTENIGCKSEDVEEAYLMFDGEKLSHGFFVPVEGFKPPKTWKRLGDKTFRICEDSKVYLSSGMLFVTCGSKRLGYPYVIVLP